jgi:hypothetical protein
VPPPRPKKRRHRYRPRKSIHPGHARLGTGERLSSVQRAKAALNRALTPRRRRRQVTSRSREKPHLGPEAFRPTGKPTTEYLQPPSEKYDMPEYDLR